MAPTAEQTIEREGMAAGDQAPKPLEWIPMLGVRVSCLTAAAALERLEQFIESGLPHLVVTADSSGVVIASEDEAFRRIVNEADMVTADSTGILWAARRQGTPLPERVSGCDLAEELCALAARRGYSVFF